MQTSPLQTLRALPLALAAFLVLCSCGTVSTIDSRAKEKAAAFAAAVPAEQKLMREGWVDYGFTPDMVYIALDQPDKVALTAEGGNVIWIYKNFDTRIRSFAGGVKVNVQAGSALEGQGSNAAAAGPRKFLSASIKPDLSAAQSLDPVSTLYLLFRQGRLVTCKVTRE